MENSACQRAEEQNEPSKVRNVAVTAPDAHAVPRVVWAEMDRFGKCSQPFWWPAVQLGPRHENRYPVALICISSSSRPGGGELYSEESEAIDILEFCRPLNGDFIVQDIPQERMHSVPLELDAEDRFQKARDAAISCDESIRKQLFNVHAWLQTETLRKCQAERKNMQIMEPVLLLGSAAADPRQPVDNFKTSSRQPAPHTPEPFTSLDVVQGNSLDFDEADLYEDVCSKCLNGGNVLLCEGDCFRCWHLECLSENDRPSDPESDPLKCHECREKTWKCAFCHHPQREQGLVACSAEYCGKRYHRECVTNLALTKSHPDGSDGGSIVCPRHFCGMCTGEIDLRRQFSFTRCLKCPVAYHRACMPPGLIPVDPQFGTVLHFLCSKHETQDVVMKLREKRIARNMPSCIECDGNEGMLLQCDGCPAAYHEHCVSPRSLALKGVIKKGEHDFWYCPNCTSGKMPAAGDLVFAKQGQYPFWPAEVYHAGYEKLPAKLWQVRHAQHETLAVRWYPFREHKDIVWSWLSNCFVVPVEQFKISAVSQAKEQYRLALEQMQAVVARKINRALPLSRKGPTGEIIPPPSPPPFTMISSNLYLIERCVDGERNVTKCRCSKERPCTNDTCLNRQKRQECPIGLCGADMHCENQRFSRHQTSGCRATIKLIPTRTRGWVVQTSASIRGTELICELVGEVLDVAICRHRLEKRGRPEQGQDDSHHHAILSYLVCLDKNTYLDSALKGNVARFVNHSCSPNCEIQFWKANNGETRVGLFALREIAADEEITFKYSPLQVTSWERFGIMGPGSEADPNLMHSKVRECWCGAENCDGFVEKQPNDVTASSAVLRRRRQLINGTAMESVLNNGTEKGSTMGASKASTGEKSDPSKMDEKTAPTLATAGGKKKKNLQEKSSPKKSEKAEDLLDEKVIPSSAAIRAAIDVETNGGGVRSLGVAQASVDVTVSPNMPPSSPDKKCDEEALSPQNEKTGQPQGVKEEMTKAHAKRTGQKSKQVSQSKRAKLNGVEPASSHSQSSTVKRMRAAATQDSLCYSCKEPETASKLFLTCKYAGCEKKFHEVCVDMVGVTLNSKYWKCGAHFCDKCGEAPEQVCSDCPHAYCREHKEDQIFGYVDDNQVQSFRCYECVNVRRKSKNLVTWHFVG
ncbi:Histone-lysine N-methyltransferase, H3 lysine-36 and H4 lysine-20 specific [Porphyridium purpureum]|uniref:Histone-lysine N-methyltransferase, H3 lysine-36 and H4 lysine-20 specific n=1 Tax=Porphyridium purpureum TaxID=35688 RepID=A0A5J4Z5I3_PORPP|nr:Histone-lysine N-methyltransferase, H3 lysine-36 and H4 lysine-20 specific [Porphyridium purpureum]|eukprot:POR6374..scf295_1